MPQENGQGLDHAIEVIRHLRAKHSPSLEAGYYSILVALAKVYRKHDNSIVDHGTMSVIRCEREVHHVSETDFLDAIRLVYQPKYPIVYPTQFQPVMIIHPDGTVLWMATPEPRAMPSEPANPEPTEETPA